MPGIVRDESFEQLFDAVFDRSLGVARRIVGDRTTAEDVAAEAFARAYARWPRLRDEPGREGWVLRVTANLAIDVSRKRPAFLRSRPVSDLGDEVAVRVALASALDSLPKRQRSVVVLRYLADLSEAETATALGIAPGTVKAHLHRAMEHMRRDLLAYADADPDQPGPESCGSSIIVRDLRTGQERRWEPEDNGWDNVAVILRISWAPDSRRLVFDQIFEGSGIAVLDTATTGSLKAALTYLDIDGSDDSQRSPTWLNDGDHVVVALSCCYAENEADANRIVSVSTATGASELLAQSVDDAYIVAVAADPTGRHLIYSTADADLVIVEVGGTTVSVDGSFVEVDW